MKFNGIETVDLFEGVTVFWACLSDMPEAVQSKAKEIDGNEYDAQGFGAYVSYDIAKNNFSFSTDSDLATGGGNIFYVDADGDRHWFRVEIGDDFTKQIFDACDRINGCIDTPRGYTIQKTVQFDRNLGLVLAKKDDPTYPLTAWMFKETEDGRRDYVWSRSYANEKTAEKAFANAVAVHTEHERTFYSHEVKAATWGSGKKPSIKAQLAAKPVPGDKPAAKIKDREVR